MKAFSFLAATTAAALLLPGAYSALAGEDPTVAGPFTELRKNPLFASPTLPLAKTWGPAIPLGTSFQVEKVYGRWIYGHPLPLKNMLARDYAPSGWVFSRMLLIPGDSNSLPPILQQQSRSILFHERSVWKKLGLTSNAALSSLDFLESLVLSTKTLSAFSKPEGDAPESRSGTALLPEAFAAEEALPAALGLTGSELSFLQQEIKVIQEQKRKQAIIRESKKLKPPAPPVLDETVRQGLLGRYMLDRYLELPSLSMEEVDGFIYMRATAMRALSGCPKVVQNHWKSRRWNFFRVFNLKSRPEQRHPWFEIALPGGYFAVSGRAIELAGNEAEFAFLLVRQLVRELRVKRPPARMLPKSWPEGMQNKAEELWDQVLKAQSTKDAENIDVSDEIAVDTQAIECLARAGYRPLAAVSYLKKLLLNKDKAWAEWFVQHSIGLEYRIERLQALAQEAIAQQRIPDSKDTQVRRFSSAAKQWNILP